MKPTIKLLQICIMTVRYVISYRSCALNQLQILRITSIIAYCCSQDGDITNCSSLKIPHSAIVNSNILPFNEENLVSLELIVILIKKQNLYSIHCPTLHLSVHISRDLTHYLMYGLIIPPRMSNPKISNSHNV